MGKANRRKKIDPSRRQNQRPPVPFVDRPFADLARERELVAMREIIPCAVLSAKTTAEHGDVEFDFVTMLPDGAGAMVRGDGRIMVGLQTRFHSGDLSHDAGGALTAAIKLKADGEEGVASFDVRDPAPRLQDMLVNDDSQPEMELRADFEFWLDPTEEIDSDMAAALEQNRDDMVETSTVEGVEGMYWCAMNNNFVRYVVMTDEDSLYTALARLQAAGQAVLGEDSKFVGAFRACGIGIPVFQVDPEATVEELQKPAAALEKALAKALKNTDPLTDQERRARAGMVSRQVTIR